MRIPALTPEQLVPALTPEQLVPALTPEQLAKKDDYIKEWTSIGLKTGPADFEAAKRHMTQFYINMGLPYPEIFIHAKSPVDAAHKIFELDSSRPLHAIVQDMCYGNLEAPWLALYAFLFYEVGVKEIAPIEPLFHLAKCAGWLSMYDKVAVIQDYPSVLSFDENNELHCASRPAVAYSDGTELYLWRGQKVPADWIKTPGFLTPQMAITHPNMDERFAAMEIMGGWDKLFDSGFGQGLPTTLISDYEKDDNGVPNLQLGKIIDVQLPDAIRPTRFLYARCGTGRTVALIVPNHVKTAVEAQAILYRITEDQVRKIKLRT